MDTELLFLTKENETLTTEDVILQKTKLTLSEELQSIEDAIQNLGNPVNVNELEEYAKKENELRRGLEEYRKSLVYSEEIKEKIKLNSNKYIISHFQWNIQLIVINIDQIMISYAVIIKFID